MDTNTHTYYLIGLYYFYKKRYDEMKKYHHIAINLGNSIAMNMLGYYYEKIEHNYDEMKKYYLMAINLGCSDSMFKLGCYYILKQNYEEMKKYYLMAINLNQCNSMYNLGVYYHTIEYNYEEMIKYYHMAIKHYHNNAFNNLLRYYIKQKNYIFIYFMLYRLNYNNKFTIHTRYKFIIHTHNVYDLTNYINTLNKLWKLINTIKIQQFICIYKDNILYNPDYGLMIPLLQSKWRKHCTGTL